MTFTPISVVHSLPIVESTLTTTATYDNSNSSSSSETITESIPLHRFVRQTTKKRDENTANINDNGEDDVRPYLHFESMLPEQVVIEQDERYVLECDVAGTPNPIIYWLRNGKLVHPQQQQQLQKNLVDLDESSNDVVSLSMLMLSSSIRPSSSDHLGLSRVKSRLFLECLNPETDLGTIYTCVAVTPFEQKRSNTKVIIVPRRSSSPSLNPRYKGGNEKEMELFGNSLIENSLIPIASSPSANYHKIINNQSPSGNGLASAVSCLEKKSLNSPAKIYFWTQTLMENMGNNVIIHCRATGFPKPRINWFVNGQITSSINDKYQILPNGDLFIHNSTFDDMGVYQCMASNEFGSDSIDEIFFYPTMKE
ncbi:hypothetical protein HUG17_3414 [Dermatophagoides farinae]|nr:hypothetical protein HUG17_3414 [Dermatophagoides farinae]